MANSPAALPGVLVRRAGRGLLLLVQALGVGRRPCDGAAVPVGGREPDPRVDHDLAVEAVRDEAGLVGACDAAADAFVFVFAVDGDPWPQGDLGDPGRLV